MDRFPDDSGVRADGAGANVIGASEDGDAGSTHCIGDMHGSAVVGKHEFTIGYQLDEFVEFGAAGIIVYRNAAGLKPSLDDGDDVRFRRAAKEGDPGAARKGYTGSGFSESLGIPTFGGSESGARADPNYRLRMAFNAIEANGGFCIVAVNPAGQTEELKVIETFVTNYGHRDWMGKEEPPAVAIVAGAFGDTGEKCEGGGFKGILQQEGLVEAAPETLGQGELGGPAVVGISDYFIAEGF
jgi:hypothetical protein